MRACIIGLGSHVLCNHSANFSGWMDESWPACCFAMSEGAGWEGNRSLLDPGPERPASSWKLMRASPLSSGASRVSYRMEPIPVFSSTIFIGIPSILTQGKAPSSSSFLASPGHIPPKHRAEGARRDSSHVAHREKLRPAFQASPSNQTYRQTEKLHPHHAAETWPRGFRSAGGERRRLARALSE